MASASPSDPAGPAPGPQPGIRATRPISPILQRIPTAKPPGPPRTVMEAFKRFELDPNSPEYREMKMAAIRKYRTRNFAVAGSILAFVAGTYYYTLFATKQEDFDSVEVPAKRASSS